MQSVEFRIDIAHRFLFLEDVPEAKCFIPGSGDHRFAIGTQRRVQHTLLMAQEFRERLHRRVLPQHDLILGVAVRRKKFVGRILRPNQLAHLRAGIAHAQRLTRQRRTEAYVPIGCTTAGSQKSVLKWRPRDRLDSR